MSRNREKSKRARSIVLIIIFVGAIVIGFLIWQDSSYVRLIDAIGQKDNEKVEKLLKRPFFTLDKVSGHIPFRWIVDTGERNSPLEQACKCGNYEAAKMLIDKGADASLVQDGHFSLLYMTMEETDKDDYELVRLLVENGADPKGSIDNDGEPSLVKCAYMDCGDYQFNSYTQKYTGEEYDKAADYGQHYDKGRAEMILKIYKYLERRTGYAVVEDEWGATPLSAATARRNIGLMKYLFAEGSYDVNKQSSSGRTCIFSLPERDDEEHDQEWKKETLGLLIENGADPNEKDEEGKTVYDVAIDYGDKYLAGLLEPYMNR